MKASLLITVFLIIALAGGFSLVAYQKALPDVNGLRKDIVERTLTIDGLDAKVNELAIRNRYNLDVDYDALTRTTSLLDKAVRDFERTYFADNAIDDDLLMRHFTDFKNELELKKEVIENFKTHNSVLRNSEKYAPEVGRKLVVFAKDINAQQAGAFYMDIIQNMLEYALLGSSVQLENLKIKQNQLSEIEKQMPNNALSEVIAFAKHLDVVIVEKEETDTYLRKIMLTTTDENLDQLSQSWDEWLFKQQKKHDKFKNLLIVYITGLLLFIMATVWILRSLYRSMDRKVEERTRETHKAFQELKENETQLMQSEKMASLGQLVTGITYEMNTPLGYVSSNVNTIGENIGDMDKIYVVIDQLSQEVSQPKPDSKKMVVMLKQLVKLYMQNGQQSLMTETQQLLTDATDGLSEISTLVNSLKDYGSVDQSEMKTVNLNDNIDTTLEMCKTQLGDREIIKKYGDLADIECVSSQMNQVFMNIFNNAIDATDESDGQIVISSENDKSGVIISIADNGHGMNDNTVKHMFDPFFTTRDVGQGVGLGMAVTYRIIKSHGGEIIVDSGPDKGSKIIVKLPFKHPQNR